MHARVMRAIRVAAAAGALAVAGLAGSGGAGAAFAGGHAAVRAGGPAANASAGFAVASVSFWSPASGVALGGVGCSYGTPCAARLMATADSGARWQFLRAPAVSVAGGSSGLSVSRVLFTGTRRGWLYRPALWFTGDGGAHWRKLSLGGAVEAMAAGGGKVYAVVSRPGSKVPELFASPAGGNSWARVGQVSGRVLAVYGRSAWLATSNYVWATANGVKWHKFPFRCPARAGGVGLAGIAAASPARVLFICLGSPAGPQQVKVLLGSANGGRTSRVIRTLPLDGDGAVIAVPPGRPSQITLGTEYYLDHSANGGKTWTVKAVAAGGGAPWNTLTFLSPAAGWAEVGGPPTYDALLHTINAGRTWRKISF